MTATVVQLRDRQRLRPAYLVEITLLNSGPTLYLADRTLPDAISGQLYDHYIKNITGLTEEVKRNDSTFLNSKVTITFLNDKWGAYNYLIEAGETYPFDGASIVIKEVLVDYDGTMPTPTTIFKGNLDQPDGIDLKQFICRVSASLYAKKRKWAQKIIDKTTWANSWEDVGVYEPIIYGAAGYVPCPRVDWGIKTTLVEDITAAATTGITLTDKDSRISGSGTIIIDNEDISYTGVSSRVLTGVTRGANSTAAAAHQAGATVWKKQTNYDSLIAAHECHSFGDVLAEIGGQLWRITAGVSQVFTGGKHLLRATSQLKVAPLDLGINTGSHSHSVAQTTTHWGTSGSLAYYGGSAWTNTAPNLYDHSLATNCFKSCSGAVQVGANAQATVNFPGWGGGTITAAYICVRHSSTKSGAGTVKIKGGFGSYTLDTSGAAVTQKFSTGTSIYSSYVDLYAFGSGDVASSTVYEIWYEISTSDTGDSPADGVALVGSTISTLSVDRFHISVNGAKDDGNGTYTGSAGALIERPDHVFKHWLLAQLGYVAGDLASWTAAGTSYNAAISGGYKFAFRIGTKIDPGEWLKQMAFECRSVIKEKAGLWYLNYIPDTAPAVVKTIGESELAGGRFVFGTTQIIDLANDLRAKFKKDYSQQKPDSDWLLTSAAADSTSKTKYGTYPKELTFLCIRLQAMADHVLAHILLEDGKPHKTVTFPIFWEHFDLVVGDTFDISSSLFNAKKFFIESFSRLDQFKSQVKGLEW